jgi:two-component sensor histidine kinase
MSSSAETATAAALVHAEDRLLWERCRVGYMVVMAGIAVVMAGEFVLRPWQRPGIGIVQALNIAVLGFCLLVGRDPAARNRNCVLCFLAFAVTAVAIGAAGILAGDPTSPIVVLVGLAMGAAVLVPWGARYQFPGVLVAIAVATWTLADIKSDSDEFWLQPIGSILPTFGASVIVAYLLRRERVAVAAAEDERVARERGLRDANRRLEIEIHDHEKTEKALRFALLELDHRVKNTLATVQSIAEQTLDTASSPQEFAEGLRGRIRAMARIHTALAAHRWEGLDLRELIELVVGPYRRHDAGVSLTCDDAALSAVEARAIGTALHELATNAAKYGALSTREGRVGITAAVANGSERRLHLVWSEQGGPKVDEPTRRGLGTKLIEAALAYESGGTARLSFEESGVRCEIDMPLRVAHGDAR